MRKLAQMAAAALVALPLMGVAATGTAQAADVAFSVSVGYDDARAVNYDRPTYGYRYGRHQALPGIVVRRSIQRDFYRVRDVDRRGDVYVARAVDWRGRNVRVVASAYTGQIVDVDYISWNGRGWREHGRWNDWRDGRGRHDNDRRDYDRRDDGHREKLRWYNNDDGPSEGREWRNR